MLKYDSISVNVWCGDSVESFSEYDYEIVDFPVIKLNNEPYDYLVIKAMRYGSSNIVDKIAEDLNIKQATFLFDAFISHKNSFNRFIKRDYDSSLSAFDVPTEIVAQENVSNNIKNISLEYFYSH